MPLWCGFVPKKAFYPATASGSTRLFWSARALRQYDHSEPDSRRNSSRAAELLESVVHRLEERRSEQDPASERDPSLPGRVYMGLVEDAAAQHRPKVKSIKVQQVQDDPDLPSILRYDIEGAENGGSGKAPAETQWSFSWRSKYRLDLLDERFAQTHSRVQNAFQAKFGEQYKIAPFGSAVYGGKTVRGDLDLCVLDPANPFGTTTSDRSTLPIIYNLNNIARMLRKAGFLIRRVTLHAAVAVVKFYDPVTMVECDININERIGVINSRMLAAYCEIQPDILRPMLRNVKEWARPLGLNNPAGEEGRPSTFSSYAFALMTIAFLQRRGLLPSLHQRLPPLAEGELSGTFAFRGNRWDIRSWSTPRRTWSPAPGETDPDILLQHWHHFWGWKYDYVNMTADIRRGGILPTPEGCAEAFPAPDQLADHYRHGDVVRCIVQEPFVLDRNVTKYIGKEELMKFRQACQEQSKSYFPTRRPPSLQVPNLSLQKEDNHGVDEPP